ncbi:serologically defined colon cancer antigen 3-like protein [Labeo rohita]|uniref:Endosome-associated-trafficking regulator 1 n=1 Tax=Labeo rohita TaxID=84645 RepID=A0A498MX14_LABRO|nr:serologically defined colon cancer antigen 3-like protein [Labeo rohita]
MYNFLLSDEPKQDELNPFSFKEFIRNKNQQSCPTEAKEVCGGACHVEQDYNTSIDYVTKGPFFTDPSVLDLGAYSEQSSLCSDEREANVTEWELGHSDFLPQNHLARRSTGSYEGDEETSVIDISFHPKRSNAENGAKNPQQLREENSLLRKQVKELLRRSESDSKRQLLSGRDTLCFVSQLLTSIDKITEIHD